MADLWVDPEGLAAVSPQFEKLGEDVNAALQTLRQGIQAERRCWGGDKPGKQFEANYPQGNGTGGVGASLDSLGRLAEVLRTTGDKITSTAGGLRSQDDHTAAQVNNAESS